MTKRTEQEEQIYYEIEASEQEFLEWYRTKEHKKYERPSVTIDNVMLAYNREEDALKILLIKRKAHPYKGCWALPGGFVNPNESTDKGCLRETFEETGVQLKESNIEQLYTFSTPNRDPRDWVITVSYMAFLNQEALKAGDDASEAAWFDITLTEGSALLHHQMEHIGLDLVAETTSAASTGNLAFDHEKIISTAIKRIVGKMYYQPRLLTLLGESFTIAEARKVYAKFLGVPYQTLDHSNFKKDLLKFLKEVDERPTGVGRPSKFYALDIPYLK